MCFTQLVRRIFTQTVRVRVFAILPFFPLNEKLRAYRVKDCYLNSLPLDVLLLTHSTALLSTKKPMLSKK